MRKAKWLIAILTLLTVGAVFYFQKKQEESMALADNSLEEINVVKKYRDDGSLKADAEMMDGLKHGVARNYYANGKVHSEIYYKQDVKHGLSTWFYQSGKIYRLTPYEHGKKSGVQKKYYESGKIMAEIPYHNNKVQLGTKEYWEMGKEIEKYPELIVENNRSIFYLSFKPKVKKANYFAKVKINEGYSTIKAKNMEGKGIVDLKKYKLKDVELYAEYTTERGNKKLIKTKID